jgi:hypothetical protein
VIRAPRQLLEFEAAERCENRNDFRDDIPADAVSRDDDDPLRHLLPLRG